jgi:N6-L-threonylcarbamoyladenine synthase
MQLDDVDGIATRGPGLIGSLLVGLSVAKGIALRRALPLVGVSSRRTPAGGESTRSPATVRFPSSGSSSLAAIGVGLARRPRVRRLGKTRDDAVGGRSTGSGTLGLGRRSGDPIASRVPAIRRPCASRACG